MMLEEDDSSRLLRLKADWGGANLTRAAGWITQWVWDNTTDHRQAVIYTGRGMGDNLRALGAGDVDIALATPASFARLAREGVGPFEGAPIPDLVALGVLPHRDAMIPVVRKDLGITTLAELAAHPGPLRISLGVNDPDGFMGFAADAVLSAAGVELEDVVARGGQVTRHEQPFDVIADLHEGRADVMISEAIMTPDWQELSRDGSVVLLSLADDEVAALDHRWGLRTIELPGGYFPHTADTIRALDYSGWIVAATSGLPDEFAQLVAQAFSVNSEALARGYRHLPVDYSPLRYPVDLPTAIATPIPLHPAAEAVYLQKIHGHEELA
ncbi:hypothetical protein F1D05_29850 [Kribbella qitaiheensis]|uniref:TAXI family TRAP transporter solute-binding subunit n=1 Tax=Kribbella qitaiheensis TaxID=1544730 RepID=A0A7G6X542_9ACTN|nr:TAXI family TRAP transporter solute-binding subunit [Kribbella qitaiheensis]QNE21357.1 hypothetical protein F1D05_29850 [Kribbella qitaiheensis]